jgi:Cu+-exporting ATPase
MNIEPIPTLATHGSPTVPPASVKTIYTCSMHPDVQQDHPGDCPKCGMTLVLNTPGCGA